MNTPFFPASRVPLVASLVALVVFAGLLLPVRAAEVTLAWDPNPEPDIAGYRIHYGMSPGDHPYCDETGMATMMSFADLPGDTLYYFVVTAYNSAGLESLPSEEISVRTSPNIAPPSTPGSLMVSSGNESITVEWAELTSEDISGYTVYRSPTSGEAFTPVATGLTSGNYVDTGLENGTTYYYVVTATNGAGQESPPSVEVSATPVDTIAPLVNLTAGGATVTGDFEISVAFSELVSGLDLTDFAIGGGFASALAGEGASYTTTISPTLPGMITVTLPAGAAHDAGGNGNLAGNLLSVAYEPPPTAEPVQQFATGETTQRGTVTGSIGALAEADGVYEVLTETSSGGKPNARFSQLQHTWTFTVYGSNPVLHVAAFHSPSLDGDDFVFSYSVDGTTFTEIIVITDTTAGERAQSASLGEIAGTVSIRVEDRNHQPGSDLHFDSLFVDALSIETSAGGGIANRPPSFEGDPIGGSDATAGRPYTSTLAGRASDADGDALVFSKSEGPAWLTVALDGSLDGIPTSADLGDNLFSVKATDGRGGIGMTTLILRVVPASGSIGMHVSKIALSGISYGGNRQSVLASVTVVDETGSPVSGATVSVRWSGATSESTSAVTATNGVALTESRSVKGGGTFTVEVTGIVATGFAYAPAGNVISSGTFTTR